MLQLIANHACKELHDYLDDLTLQIWCFLKNAKNQRVYQEFQQFDDVKPHKFLKAGHEQTHVHQANQKSQNDSPLLTSYFSPARGHTGEQSVIEA